jgi:decaprenyl-phosphate phosphoribosyltransferase
MADMGSGFSSAFVIRRRPPGHLKELSSPSEGDHGRTQKSATMSPTTTTHPRVAPGRPGARRVRLPSEFGAVPGQHRPAQGAEGWSDPATEAGPTEPDTYGSPALDPGQASPIARVWIRELRCRQWIKNLLVFAAPAAADALGNSFVAGRAALAFVVFVLVSSATYLGNDVVDLEEDRRHPVKRHRPLAAGEIPVPDALIAAAGCLVVALVTAAMVDVRLLLIVLVYAGVNLAYTGWGRRIPVADLVFIATCFLLRAVAGGVATGIPVSPWFIAVVMLGALLVAAGKRYGDLLDPLARRSRSVLRSYSPQLLRRIGLTACAGTLAAYALWAVAGGPTDVPALREFSLVPFAAAILRYCRLVADGAGGAPEQLFLEDRLLQLAGVVWLMLFLSGA